jgi:hypothetical protein
LIKPLMGLLNCFRCFGDDGELLLLPRIEQVCITEDWKRSGEQMLASATLHWALSNAQLQVQFSSSPASCPAAFFNYMSAFPCRWCSACAWEKQRHTTGMVASSAPRLFGGMFSKQHRNVALAVHVHAWLACRGRSTGVDYTFDAKTCMTCTAMPRLQVLVVCLHLNGCWLR